MYGSLDIMDANRWEEFHRVAAKMPYEATSRRIATYETEMAWQLQYGRNIRQLQMQHGILDAEMCQDRRDNGGDYTLDEGRLWSNRAVYRSSSAVLKAGACQTCRFAPMWQKSSAVPMMGVQEVGFMMHVYCMRSLHTICGSAEIISSPINSPYCLYVTLRWRACSEGLSPWARK